MYDFCFVYFINIAHDDFDAVVKHCIVFLPPSVPRKELISSESVIVNNLIPSTVAKNYCVCAKAQSKNIPEIVMVIAQTRRKYLVYANFYNRKNFNNSTRNNRRIKVMIHATIIYLNSKNH